MLLLPSGRARAALPAGRRGGPAVHAAPRAAGEDGRHADCQGFEGGITWYVQNLSLAPYGPPTTATKRRYGPISCSFGLAAHG